MTATAEAALKRARKLCLGLPEVNERPSHGAPTFFIREKRSFVMFLDNHHGDGRLGWLGARLDRRLDNPELAGAIEDAYETVESK